MDDDAIGGLAASDWGVHARIAVARHDSDEYYVEAIGIASHLYTAEGRCTREGRDAASKEGRPPDSAPIFSWP